VLPVSREICPSGRRLSRRPRTLIYDFVGLGADADPWRHQPPSFIVPGFPITFVVEFVLYMCSSIHRRSGVHTPFLWKHRDIKPADDLYLQENYVACKSFGFAYSSPFVFSYLVAPRGRTANRSSMDRIFVHWGFFCSLALFLCLSTQTAAQAVSPSVPPAVVKEEAAQILLQDSEKPCNRAVSL
jgi:hypothetical protein